MVVVVFEVTTAEGQQGRHRGLAAYGLRVTRGLRDHGMQKQRDRPSGRDRAG